LGISHAFKFLYRKQLIQKTVAMVDGGLLQDMKLNVLSTMHFIAESWILITPATIKNCFMKYGFSNDVSNDAQFTTSWSAV
jgi:hypothetical protein